jgi:hypothetical protein
MALVWPALAFLLVVLTVGTTVTTIRAVRLFRAMKRLGEAVSWGTTRLTQASWDLERSLDRLPARIERLERAQERLSRSLAVLDVLAKAASRSQAQALGVRALVPKK